MILMSQSGDRGMEIYGCFKRARTEGETATETDKFWRPQKIAPSSFYTESSVHWQAKLNRLTKPLSPSEIKPELTTEDFPVFSKQEAAFQHVDAQPELRLRVFSFEKPNFGAARQFVAADFETFWRRYSLVRPRERHFYEVIREGEPCHLYFDLEFLREHNELGCDDETLTNRFCELLLSFISARMGITCSRANIVDLDSSTEKKYSRHLIIHLPGCMWKSNIECGRFVRAFIMFLLYLRQDSQEAASCFVNTDKNAKVFLADVAVYSRNRNFRLYKSSKVGKDTVDAVLNPSESNQFRYSSEKELFMASLICRSDPVEVKANGTEVQSELRLLSSIDITILEHEKHVPSTSPYALGRLGFSNSAPRNMISSDTSSASAKLSPHPCLDAFVMTQISKGGQPGYIRSWLYYPEERLLVYNVGGNRYCGNIGRAHKSNHTMMVADLRKKVVYQKCHDPDCKAIDYRSPDVPFPSDVRDEVHARLLNEEYDRLYADLDENFWRKMDEVEASALSQSQSSVSSSQHHNSSSAPSSQVSRSAEADLWAEFDADEADLLEDMRLHPEKYP